MSNVAIRDIENRAAPSNLVAPSGHVNMAVYANITPAAPFEPPKNRLGRLLHQPHVCGWLDGHHDRHSGRELPRPLPTDGLTWLRDCAIGSPA